MDMPLVESSLCQCAKGGGNPSETHFSAIFHDFTKGVIHSSHFLLIFTSFFSHFYCEKIFFGSKDERKMD